MALEGNVQRKLKLLVPLDGSKMAESVLQAARYLSSGYEAEIVLLHVIEHHVPPTIHGERHLGDPKEAELYLEEQKRLLASEGTEVRFHVHSNEVHDVAASIVEHAEENAPDFILLCTHGSGGIQGLLFGSIAQQVLKRGRWPVLLVPPLLSPSQAEFQLKHILVPIEPEHHPEQAVQQALQFAGRFGAEIHLTMVVPTRRKLAGERALAGLFMPGATEAMLDEEEKELMQRLEKQRAALAPSSVQITTAVRRGDPVQQVIGYAEEVKADLIVLTSHTKVGIEALLAGSIGPRIMGQASQSILLLKTQ